MRALDELLKIEKEIEEKKSGIDKLVDRMVAEESESLGRSILASMGDFGGDDEAHDDGFRNAYIAMCYQTHYREFHSYERIQYYMEHSCDDYELPDELRNILTDDTVVPEYDEYGELITDEVACLEKDIRERALSYAWGVIKEDHETADREAMRRGEIGCGGESECENRSTFENANEARRFVDKTKNNTPYRSSNYKQLQSNLFNFFGPRFVNRFLKKVIINLKKKSAEEYRQHVEDEHHILRTAWDVICVCWEDCSDSFPDEVIKEEILKQFEELSAEEKMLLWYFNTYKKYSSLEEYFYDEEHCWQGEGVSIDQEYQESTDEVVNVLTQRILWIASEDNNYRTEFYTSYYTQKDLDECFDVSYWDNVPTEKMTADYHRMFDEDFPLEPEENRLLLIQCLDSNTPWSKDTDLTIKIGTNDSQGCSGETSVNDDYELTPWERRMSYFFPMIKDRSRIDDSNEGLSSFTLQQGEDLDEVVKSAYTPFAKELSEIVEGLNWFVACDDNEIILVWDNMVPVYGDVHVKKNNLIDTAEQVRGMVERLDTNKILQQLLAWEGLDETGKPNNFFEVVRLTEAYENDLKALSAKLDESKESSSVPGSSTQNVC